MAAYAEIGWRNAETGVVYFDGRKPKRPKPRQDAGGIDQGDAPTKGGDRPPVSGATASHDGRHRIYVRSVPRAHGGWESAAHPALRAQVRGER